MRIKAVYLHEAGPLGTQVFRFIDDWREQLHDLILISGPNGSGKSHLLRSVAMLWSAWGYWLHHRSQLKEKSVERRWLQRWGGVGVRLTGLPFVDEDVILAFGDTALYSMLEREEGARIIGEVVKREGKAGKPRRALIGFDVEEDWQLRWGQQYQMMSASFNDVELPNLIYLDAEERRWISPRGEDVGEIKGEDSKLRWLVSYRVTERWEGQLEAALLAIKAADQGRFEQIIASMNKFLAGKSILDEVRLGENRLRVRIERGGLVHYLDELSAGEHQVLIHVYNVARWLERGGVVLIDEPDLHLHPSLLTSLMSELERMIRERGGQLLVTSHSPELWRRYDNMGMRIELG